MRHPVTALGGGGDHDSALSPIDPSGPAHVQADRRPGIPDGRQFVHKSVQAGAGRRRCGRALQRDTDLYGRSSIFSQQFPHKQRFGRVVTPSLMSLPSSSRIVQSFSVVLQEKPKPDGAFAPPPPHPHILDCPAQREALE